MCRKKAFGVSAIAVVAISTTIGEARAQTNTPSFEGKTVVHTTIVAASHTAPFHTYEDLKERSMNVGGSGQGSASSNYPLALNAILGTKFNVIMGYPGSSELILAMERGELDGWASWSWRGMRALRPEWVADNKVRVLLQLVKKGDPELSAKGVPTAMDVATTDVQKRLLEIAFAPSTMARPFVAPPDLPPDRLRLLRQAFEAAGRDQQMIAEGEKSGNDIDPVPADELIATLNTSYSTDPSLLKQLQTALAPK